jgi:hypothetical protein
LAKEVIMLNNLIRSVEILSLAYAFGATVWFFFVQSPVLVKRMGRDNFVPLQMSMVGPLFRSLSLVLLIMVVATLAQGFALLSVPVLTALLALAGALINTVHIVPRALKQGGKSRKEELDAEAQKSVARFAADGGGKASRVLHRLVVLFVVVMFAGLIPHAVWLVS